jgi:hypothetical protein
VRVGIRLGVLEQTINLNDSYFDLSDRKWFLHTSIIHGSSQNASVLCYISTY